MKTIIKHMIDSENSQVLNLHSEDLLSVKEVDGKIYILALEDSNNNENCFEIKLYQDGESLDVNIDKFKFLGTIVKYQSIIYNIFYRKILS